MSRILIVDDVKSNVLLMERFLKKNGYTPVAAYSGAEALQKVQNDEIDAVVMDVMMPDMDGYETTRKIKANDDTKHIPIILFTAQRCDRSDRFTGLESGADEYATKPIDEEELTAKLRALLRVKELYDQLRDVNKKLLELDKVKEDLTHMIVHDLRNPLTGVLGYLQLLGSTNLDDQQVELVESALHNARQLLGMINDLLDISKIEEGKIVLLREYVKINDVVYSAIKQTKILADEKQIIINIDIHDDEQMLHIDKDKVLRLLVNLIGNSIKFTPSGGEITIQTRQLVANEIQFGVSDTGEGIPQEYLDKIFNKFVQVESRKAGRRMSTGLGLTFCKMVVEAHLGKIWVESIVGRGSHFYFTLPIE